MSCNRCDTHLITCSKCDFDICPVCEEVYFCDIENEYICTLCYNVCNIRIITCTECNITACLECKPFFNCYLTLCEDCIKDKVCMSCNHSYEKSTCIAWLYADICTCCLCIDQITKCINCIEYNTSKCLNFFKCTCKLYFTCENTKKLVCDECVKFCKFCYHMYNCKDTSDYCYSCKFNMIRTTDNRITRSFPPEIVNMICSFC